MPVNPPVPETAFALPEIALLLLALLALVWGIVQCFCGYRLIRMVLAFYGFLGGVLAGALSALFLFNLAGAAAVALALAAGLVGAVLLVLLLYVNVLLLGVALGALTGALLAGVPVLLLVSPDGGQSPAPPYLIVGAAVVCGVLALVFRRFVVILLTAVGGALLIAVGTLLALRDPLALALVNSPSHPPAIRSMFTRTHLIALFCCVALSLVGFIIQYRTAGHSGAVKKRDKNLDRLLSRARRDA